MSSSSIDSFDQFALMHGDDAATEVLDQVCDAAWNSGSETVFFSAIETHDPCNHTLTGTMLFRGVGYEFVIENGNANGTEVRSFEATEHIPSQLITALLKSSKPIESNSAWCW